MTEPITTVEAAVAKQGALPVPGGPATEFGIRLPDGTTLRSGNPLDRREQEDRLGRYQDSCPQARLVQRTVHYSDWTEADQ
jgi:hypothetical protein